MFCSFVRAQDSLARGWDRGTVGAVLLTCSSEEPPRNAARRCAATKRAAARDTLLATEHGWHAVLGHAAHRYETISNRGPIMRPKPIYGSCIVNLGKKWASNRGPKLKTHFGSDGVGNPKIALSLSSTYLLCKPWRAAAGGTM